MAQAALPLLSLGGSIGAGIFGHKSAKGASQPSPGEAAATQQQTQDAGALGDTGRLLTGYGMPKLQQAGTYFSQLASGNRATLGQAVAPDVANINATYGGTQRTLQRFLRGSDRDYQTAELARQRAGQIGSLFTGARQRGVEGLAALGQYGVGAGTSALSTAAGISGDVANRGMQNRYAGADLQRQAGADTASLIFQLLKSGAFSWGRGGGARMPGTPVGPLSLPS